MAEILNGIGSNEGNRGEYVQLYRSRRCQRTYHFGEDQRYVTRQCDICDSEMINDGEINEYRDTELWREKMCIHSHSSELGSRAPKCGLCLRILNVAQILL
jgi:hypothetical protein